MANYVDVVSGEKLPNGDVSMFMTQMNKELSSVKEKGTTNGLTLEDKAQAAKRSEAVMRSATDQGAEMIITACPLCLYNLKKNSNSELPVYYFTELLAEALGVKEENDE